MSRPSGGQACGPRSTHRFGRVRMAGKLLVAGGMAASVSALGPSVVAFAATGTTSATTTSGSLSIGTLGTSTLSVQVAGQSSGVLPGAQWSDTTGSGAGWNGTVQVSDFTYTGSWTQPSGTATALGSSSSAYTGTTDGVEYTVTIGSGGSGTSTPYSWTSTDPADKAGGSSLTATNGTPVSIGSQGIQIDFASGTTYPAGATYQIDAGTMASGALTLDSGATGAGIAPYGTTTSGNPTWKNDGTQVPWPTGGVDSYGAAIKFVSAAANTQGMGTYTINPGVQLQDDDSSWAATYTANVQYSIVTGP